MVALAEPLAAPRVIRRCRIDLADPNIAGSMQPYHAAKQMAPEDAQTYLERCSNTALNLAQRAVRDALEELHDYRVRRACVLLASGRPLPSLAGILASHALIHTAEGEFYRAALRDACRLCGVPETGIQERELASEAARVLGHSTDDLQSIIAGFAKTVGAPWRQDEKLATLAAWTVLGRINT